jgi:hypothetical protein
MHIIHTDLRQIIQIALSYAKRDNCNYTILILNPNEKGEFDIASGSTYEFVRDSYFEKERTNIKILYTTDQLKAAASPLTSEEKTKPK